MKVAFALACLVAVLSASGLLRADDMVDSSQYKSWAAHKEGTTITISRDTRMAGRVAKSEFKQRLVELTPERATVETVMMTGATDNRHETTQRVEIPAKVAKGQGRAGLPSDF